MTDEIPPAFGPERTPQTNTPRWPASGAHVPPVPAPPAGAHPPERPLHLREMRIGELLDAAIKLYRHSWKTLLGIASLVLVPFVFLQAFLTRSMLIGILRLRVGEIRPESLPHPSDLAIVSSLIFQLINYLFLMPFLAGAFARVASEVYLGSQPDVRDTLRFALSRTGSILLVTFLTFLAIMGGFILLIIPAFIFYIRFVFGTAVVVVEGKRGGEAMRRSWRLAKGAFWRTFGTLILAGILTAVVGGMIGFPFSAAAQLIGPKAWPLQAIGGSVGQVLTRPFATIIVVLMYFDLRIRREGLDLALMAEDLSATREP